MIFGVTYIEMLKCPVIYSWYLTQIRNVQTMFRTGIYLPSEKLLCHLGQYHPNVTIEKSSCRDFKTKELKFNQHCVFSSQQSFRKAWVSQWRWEGGDLCFTRETILSKSSKTFFPILWKHSSKEQRIKWVKRKVFANILGKFLPTLSIFSLRWRDFGWCWRDQQCLFLHRSTEVTQIYFFPPAQANQLIG